MKLSTSLIVGAVVVAVAVVSAGCTTSSSHDLRIEVDQPSALADRAIGIVVTGAAPGQRVEVSATAESARGTRWRSHASFTASPAGTVDLARLAPMSGTYAGRDAMGLFWSMRPPGVSEDYVFFYPANGTAIVSLTATAVGDVAQRTVERRLLAPGVRATDLRPGSDGLYGRYYAPPASDARHPAVLVFGGSEGGLSVLPIAELLASHGFPTLALAYFHERGLPPQPKALPLEYFARALRWLSRQHAVRGGPLVVWGASLGSEAALLLGTAFPNLVDGVVALVPSNVVACAPLRNRCAGSPWTLDGHPLPTVGGIGPYGSGKAVIPVEQIDAPILLDCGGADLLWPSCPMANHIQARLHRRGSPPATLLRYRTAGHAVGYPVPYQAIRLLATEGVSQDADEAARANAWPRILSWLEG